MAILARVSLTRGPCIEVRFHVKYDGIEQISIELSKDKTFSWVFEGEVCHEIIRANTSEWMTGYAKRMPTSIRLPLLFKEIPAYTSLVLSTLQRIPFGNALTYGEIAELTGNPRAARAVGNACGSNPFPLIIPCHSVLAQHSHIGGFSSPIEIKKCLLDFEKVSYK